MNFEAKNLGQALLDEVTRIPYDENLIKELLQKISATRDARVVCYILPIIWPIAFDSNKWTWVKTSLVRFNSSIKSDALNTISNLLTQIQPEQLPNLSACWSNSLFVNSLKRWITIDPPFIDKIEKRETGLYLLGILSFSKNGYIREKAIAALAKFPSPATLPFIICRTVDWVPEVREKALNVLESKLTPDNADSFINLLPLINRLALSSRAKVSLETKICDLYHNEPGIQSLGSALRTERKNVRLFICRILDKIADDIPEAILDIVSNDCDLAVRFWLIRWEERMRSCHASKASQLRKLLINDPSAKIRKSMILASLAAEDEDIDITLYKSLFDRSSGIREMGRYYLKKNKTFDFASLYRKMLTEQKTKLRIAIAGLGETGVSSDYELILPFLSGSSHQTREVLKALVKLDSSRAQQELLRALADHRPAVRSLALKTIPKWLSAEYEEELLNVWQRATSEEARRCVAKTMLRLPPWIAVYTLLRAVTICPRSQEASNVIEQWYPSRQKCYAPIPPDEKEKKEIEKALSAATPFLKQSLADRLLSFL